MPGLDLNSIDRKPAQGGGKGASTAARQGHGFTSWLSRDIFLFNPVNDRFKESLYLELSVLLGAGVDIRGAMELVESQQAKNRLAVLVRSITKAVVGGAGVSEAFRQSGQFSAYEFYSLQIGEETGRLTAVLEDLAGYYARKIRQRRQVVQALSYPSIVLATSVGAVAFMLRFIVPMFSDVFRRFGGELPYLTAQIIRLSEALQESGWMLGISCVAVFLFHRVNRQKLWFKRYGCRLVLGLPLVGEIVRKVYLARLCSSFSLLIGSRVPLLQAIGLVRRMIGFHPLAISLERVEKDILQGENLHLSMSRFPIYDRKMIALLKVGEEVNQLDFFFRKLASRYNEEVEHHSALLSSALEPVIIIVLGLVVGLILVAMYLPLFQLSTNMG